MHQSGTKIKTKISIVALTAMLAMGGCTAYHKPQYSMAVESGVSVDCRNAHIMINYYAELLDKEINEPIYAEDYNRGLMHQITRIRSVCGV